MDLIDHSALIGRIPMFRYLLLIVLLFPPALARAQSNAASLIAPQMARQAGLERMWFTQLSLDRGRGRMSGMFIHVSPTQAHTVFQVTHDGQRHVFSQRDRDAFGKEIGVAGAKQAAEAQVEAIKRLLQEAGNADAQAPPVETIVVPKITLYASSERGLVHALDGETGRTLWATNVGNPLYPTTSPSANDKYVAVCNGSTIYVMLATDGSVVWTKPALGAPGAGPALTEELIFIPMVSGQVESLLLDEPKRPVSVYKSFGRTMIQPVVSSNSVAWPTDAGNLYVSLAHGTGIRFRLKATDAISSAPAFLDPNKIFITSIDGYIYCIGEQKGNILWRFTNGEAISHSPIALGNTVYAISKRGNMYAVDVDTAAERWVASGIRSYLAGNDNRLYCLDTRGDLVILDADSGSRVGGIPAIPADIPIMNTQTDRIILASSTGLVQSLRESALPWPVVHYFVEPQRRTPRPLSKLGTPKAGDQTAPLPATSDPFGTPGAAPAPTAPLADPFADPNAAPRPAAPPPARDPFAPQP